MKQFKCRCSGIGQIMTNPRSKKETLSQTTKTYLQEYAKTIIYNRQKQVTSKHMTKGNICEQDSSDYIADKMGYGLLIKNEESFENDFLTGTPDAILNELIIDVKNSWDCFTFPLFAEELPNKNYFYQMQGYMALTDKQQAKVIYTLMNTPENLIEKEAYYYSKDNGYELEDVIEDFKDRMSYNEVESKYRIKEFTVERDESVIEQIYERVNQCNEYLKQITQ